MNFVEGCIVALIAGAFIFLGVMIYQSATSEKIELIAAEWVCTDTKSVVQNVLIGKVIMPQTRTICVEYKRN